MVKLLLFEAIQRTSRINMNKILKKLLIISVFIVFWIMCCTVRNFVIVGASGLVVAWGVLPMLWRYVPAMQRHFIFLNLLRLPFFCNFEEPEKRGLPGTRNFYFETEKNIKVGIWHVLPESLVPAAPQRDSGHYVKWFEESLRRGRGVVLYLHGNAGSRAVPHRVEIYDLLRKMDYHVVAVDYRGYADSSPAYVSEAGVVADVKAVYRHLRDKLGPAPLFLWGHSLGTGISTHALRDLCLEGERPSGLVLEAPFNNMREEILSCFLTAPFRRMPKFEWFFGARASEYGIAFRTDEHIAYVAAPVLILHARKDIMVPFELGKKLLETARRVRPNTLPPVKFVEFDAKFGHDYICRAPDLPQVVRSFFREATGEE